MNAIGLIMDVLLIALILAAIAYGMRLEKKLRSLREGQDGFVRAVAELNVAAGRAEAALAELRAAGEETDLLHERIVAARTLKAELDSLVSRGRPAGPAAAAAAAPMPDAPARVTAIQPQTSTERLLKALAERRPEDLPLTETPRPIAAPRSLPEDDLFEAPARRRA
ncbi:MAG: hypothetical protein J0L52_03470 [Caulobacterales bacterium]|nr:hypothetical protein [Caulobacterales bacterium]